VSASFPTQTNCVLPIIVSLKGQSAPLSSSESMFALTLQGSFKALWENKKLRSPAPSKVTELRAVLCP